MRVGTGALIGAGAGTDHVQDTPSGGCAEPTHSGRE